MGGDGGPGSNSLGLIAKRQFRITPDMDAV